MSGPLDPQDGFWQKVFENANARRAWNAALWEAEKLMEDCPPLEREDVFAALKRMIKE